MNYKELKEAIRRMFADFKQINQDQVVQMHEWERNEMRNIFALLVLGGFAGFPTPPAHITTELLPEMESEISLFLNRIQVAHDPLGELFSTLETG